MAEFKLGRIRFVWKDDWVTSTTYYKDDIVAYGGRTYLCVVGHTAAADFYTDLDNIPTKWNQFSDGQEWKGNWTSTTLYKENDIVKYGGYVYICNNGHTSDAVLEDNQPDWDLFAESFDWKSNWVATTVYKVNDIVKYGGYTYLCNTAHTAAATNALGLEADQSKWDIFSKGMDWKSSWTADTRYKVGDIVKYGGTTYLCNTGHTSAATDALGLEDDQGKWDYFNRGFEYKGQWTSATRYKVNDIVKQGGGQWICVTDNTSTASWTTDQTNWAQFVEGIEFENDWSASGVYQNGDIVRYGGNSYIAKTSHNASALTPPFSNTTDWDLFSTGFRFQGDWSGATAYKVGEIVRNGGFTYLAIGDNTNQQPPNVSYWTKVNDGFKWRGTWANTTAYVLGDTVKYGPITYTCILAHTSNSGTNRPDIDTLGTYWNALTVGNENDVLTTTGDLVYRDGAGPTRLEIGDTGQVLTVDSNDLPAWEYFGRIKKLYYVAPHGVDLPAPTYGLTLDQPWASVRYATEQILKGTENSQAAYLLQQNRTFIQREAAEWVKYQITTYGSTPGSIWNGFTNDSTAKCERDMGLIIDAITYDIMHTGNKKTIDAAESYFTALGVLVSGIQDEYLQNSAAIEYLIDVAQTVIANTAPAANYQALNGISVGDRIKQIIDSNYTAEAGVGDRIDELGSIVADALYTQSLSGLPTVDEAGYTISVKTGQFYEVLPVRVPANTAIVGDELRSTRMSPHGKLIPTNDKAKSVGTLQRLQSITDEIITNASVTPSAGNTETQYTSLQKAGSTGSTTAVSSVQANCTEIKDIVTNNTPNAYVRPTPTGGTGNAYTAGFFNSARLINANRAFIVSEVSAWINAQISGNISPFVGFVYSGTNQTKCERDVGYIVDALVYDLTYGGNLATQITARSYYSNGVFVETGQMTQLLAVLARIKDFIDNIATGDTAGWTKTTGLSQDVSGTAGNQGAFAQSRVQEIADTVSSGTEPTTIAPDITWPAAELITAQTALVNAKSKIQSDAVQYIKREFPTLNFDETLCSRDVGYIVDALGYDLLFGSNFLSIQSGLAYQRGLSSTIVVITTQLAAQQAIIDFISKETTYYAASGAVVKADNLWTDIINYVNTGTEPITVGSNSPDTDLDTINGGKILLLNKEFLAAEATAYIAATYSTTVTSATTTNDEFTCTSTSWMVAGDEIRFTGSVFGGVYVDITYYVESVVNGTTFKISDTLGGPAKNLSTASGTMTVSYYYDSARCENDVKNYVEAIAYDLMYTGNYKSVLAAKYYRNAFTGSKLEDFFWVSNGCGLRNCTLTGLDGTSDGNTAGAGDADGLSAPNEYGTQRPLAGAYVSLDPGWGPNDETAWVTNKSTYVQNVTTFGNGATGQKIDGSIHAGGNDSIVSNDFTQVISNGIGAWVTNLGRAELVSVFTYYGHIGYLSENGGKIRATNGNNSYGDFGSVAEGVDITETPVLGQINNRGTEADVRNVITDGSGILAYEFGNAGSHYTEATFTTSGAGVGAATIANEFRDGAVFQVRLTDPGDSSGPGGTGYITQSNQAQSGNTTTISLAVADTASSAAYVGMSIYLTAGLGAGQYGYIQSYNSASKLATIYNETTGAAGWEHISPATAIASSLDTTTTYVITPRLSFTAPTYSSTARTLPSNVAWSDVAFGNGVGTYTSLSASGGSGSLATFDVVRVQGAYTVTPNVPGVSYVVGNTLTILGTAVGGTSPANDISITVTAASLGGGVTAISYAGTPVTPKFVAVASGSTSAAYSTDGQTWTTTSMPTSLSYTAIAYGAVSGIGYYVAIASGTDTSYWSRDGLNWTAATLPSSTTWVSVSYGNGRFVAVASGGTANAYSTNGGQTWTSGGVLPASTTWTDVVYGGGLWVAVASGGTQAASSANGGSTWTSRTLPSSGNWNSVTFGNNTFVAVRDGSTAYAVSANGTAWTAQTLPGSLTGAKVHYGAGVFLATATDSTTAYSSDTGLTSTWTSRTLSTGANPTAAAYGNPYNSPNWVSVASGTSTVASQIKCGATTKARAYVADNQLTEIWIREPGSFYTSAPIMTITDPNNTGSDATYTARVGNGAIAQPMFTNRGTGYTAAAATMSGDGYADNYQVGTFIGFKNLDGIPRAGSNVQIAGIDDIWYRLVTVTGLIPNTDGTYNATLQVSPPIGTAEAPEHETNSTIRIRYSQVRLTGHDFLDIGTGDIISTNYPGLPTQDPIPAQETVQNNGGRVFYTSTDQDGNFRVGGLFNVEQATGIATLNADAFNIAGLNELSLGSVALGGSGATITEFSTDPFFTQDSDSVIPTQRAIKAYITSQIGGGGSSLNVNTLTAGVVYVAGQTITTTTNVQLNINTKVNFKGGVVGDALVLNYFLLNS